LQAGQRARTFLWPRGAAVHDRRVGQIITIESVAGLIAFPGPVRDTPQRRGVMITRSIAVESAGRRIRANAVCPGMCTREDSWRHVDQPDLRAAVEDRIPGRPGGRGCGDRGRGRWWPTPVGLHGRDPLVWTAGVAVSARVGKAHERGRQRMVSFAEKKGGCETGKRR